MELVRTKNVATIVVFPIKKNDGTLLSGAASLDSEIDSWADGAAPDGFTDCTNEANEIGSTGNYYLSLTQTECNVDFAIIQVKSSTTGAITQVILINFKPTAVASVTVSDKTGFSLSSAGVNSIWDQLMSAISTTGSVGKLIKDYLDAAISTRLASASYTAPANSDITAIKGKTDNLPASPAAVGSAMTLVADQAVNATKIGGTTQTGRDLGASVLISPGTGTGQLDVTSGVIKANLAQILGTALTETAGYLAAGFKKVFNVASPVFTAASVNQTGDCYARVGAPAGASLAADIAAIQAKTVNLPASPAAVGSKMDIADSPSSTGVAVIVAAIWDKLLSGITTSGSIGKLIKDYLDVAVSSRLASASYTTPPTAVQNRQEMDSNSTKLANLDTAVTTRAAASTALSNATWSNARAALLDYLDALISSRLATAAYSAPPSAAGIADQVWDEQTSGHTATGSAGKALSSASAPSVSEIDAQLSGNHGAGAWGASAVGTIAYPDPEEPFLENGNPMVGVKVEAFSNSARTALVDAQLTDVNGNFQFHLNAGTYWFRASQAEHSSYEWSVVL